MSLIEEYIGTKERNFLIDNDASVRTLADRPPREAEAQALIVAGINGLQNVGVREQESLPYSLYTGQPLRDRNEVVARSLRLSRAAVIMGISLQEIERLLGGADFSELEFAARYGAAIGDAPLAAIVEPRTFSEVPIDSSQRGIMKEIAVRDSTLTDFFYAPDTAILPPGMQRILNESGTLSDIRTYIAPVYRTKLTDLGMLPQVH